MAVQQRLRTAELAGFGNSVKISRDFRKQLNGCDSVTTIARQGESPSVKGEASAEARKTVNSVIMASKTAAHGVEKGRISA